MTMKTVEPYKGIAGIYEEIRPSYPEKLIEDVLCKANLKPGDRLLEIGAGTGKATVQFAERGFAIKAIEIGEDMAEILKDKCVKYPKVLVDVASFEEWAVTDSEKYDMIYSAQAFHWIDKSLKYKKCHELLKDNGYLILFWYNPSNDKSPETKIIQDKIDAIVNKYASNYSADKEKPQRREHDGVYKEDERKTEIEASGLFELVEKIEYTHETRNNASQYLKVMQSVPSFASLLDALDESIICNMKKEIEQAINDNGGYVGTIFNFSLYITRKK